MVAQSDSSICGFCGRDGIKIGNTCRWCSAPYSADPTYSLTEGIIGPIDRVFLMLPKINRATAMGIARHFDTIYTGPHGYLPDPGCFLTELMLVVGIAGVLGWMAGVIIAIVVLFIGISIIAILVARAIRGAEQVRVRLQNEGRLRDAGQLLRGEVVETQQHSASLLIYRFMTPDGRWLTHTARISHMPEPPTPGTPMAIMYVDDTCYKAL